MSLTGSIFIGTSGMDAYTRGLQTISNNVANLNTLGYKEETTFFVDLFSPGGAETGFSEAGGQSNGDGVAFSAPQLDFSQGTLQQTNGAMDLAIQGGGFLVLLDGSNQVYARSG